MNNNEVLWYKKEFEKIESIIPEDLKEFRPFLVKEGMVPLDYVPGHVDLPRKEMDFIQTKPVEWKAELLKRLKDNANKFFWYSLREQPDFWYTIWDGWWEPHISLMKFLLGSFEQKPEWITMEEIKDLERKFKERDRYFEIFEEEDRYIHI